MRKRGLRDGVRVDHEKNGVRDHGVRVDHEKKSDGMRVHDDGMKMRAMG